MEKVALGRALPTRLPWALVSGSYLVPGGIVFHIFYINTLRSVKHQTWEIREKQGTWGEVRATDLAQADLTSSWPLWVLASPPGFLLSCDFFFSSALVSPSASVLTLGFVEIWWVLVTAFSLRIPILLCQAQLPCRVQLMANPWALCLRRLPSAHLWTYLCLITLIPQSPSPCPALTEVSKHWPVLLFYC